jgi:hypothetical protein
MNERRVVEIVALLAVAMAVVGGQSIRADDKAKDQAHQTYYMECAKACTMCLRECESCAHHCAHLLTEGKKEHLRTLGTCADCAEFCGSAAKITSRHGPMTVSICEACAKACDLCGTECEKSPDDEHMKQCAQACRKCERACREMVQHLGGTVAK